MPYSDLLENAAVYRKPDGVDNMTNTNCGCSNTDDKTQNCWRPPFMHECDCGQPPYAPYPYPFPEQPVHCGAGSIEGQISKLAKKACIIRKMIKNLTISNKSIIINLGPGASYNFGTYLDSEETETSYGSSILEILEAELEAIKSKLSELTSELEAETEKGNGIETTVNL